MSLVYLILLVLAISHLSLVCIYILIHYRDSHLARLLFLFSICLISYLLGTAPGEYLNQPVFDFITRRIGNACPVLIWLVSYELFVDKKRVPPIIWFLTVFYLTLRWSGAVYLILNTTYDSLILILTWAIPQFIMVGFVVHALLIAIKGFNSDLVLERRTERIAFVLSTTGLLLLIAINTSYQIINLIVSNFISILSPGLIIPTYVYSAYAYLTITIFCFWRISISKVSVEDTIENKLDPVASETAKIVIQKCDANLINKIENAMEIDKLYLKNKLTVKDLADHVSSQEYKVRRTINNHLQYRNFSDFLNHYRVSAAAQRLKETDEQISNIGLDVGYLSLSGFFKSFKEKYGYTPKEFRIKHSKN